MPALMEADLPRAPGPSHLPCKGMPGSPTVRRTSQAPHTASARGHAQLSGDALVPHYPPCFHAPRAAPAKHLTLPVMLGPHVKRKGDGAEPRFEPGTLRLLAVRSNHWAKLALMPWDNMAIWGRKLVTMARPFQLQVCSSRAACRVLSVFFPLGKIHIGWKSRARDGGLTDRTVVMEVEIRQGARSGSSWLV